MPNARVVIEGTSNVVRVHVSGETLYNLEATQQASWLSNNLRLITGQPRWTAVARLLPKDHRAACDQEVSKGSRAEVDTCQGCVSAT